MITVLSLAILYVIGYAAQERKQKEMFYGKWECNEKHLYFKYYGCCRLQDTFLYLINYKKKESQDTCEYQLYLRDRKKQEYMLNVKIQDGQLFLLNDVYDRRS